MEHLYKMLVKHIKGEELIKKRKRAKELKEAREKNAKLTAKDRAAYSSYSNAAPSLNISFLDKNV